MAGMGMGFWNIILGLIFSGVGFVAFRYGKSQGNMNAMVVGGALMVYPYFTPNALWTALVGAALTAALLLRRD